MDLFAGYIFDLDGTIYLGDHPIEGAVETIRYLQSLDKKLLFLTNKTIDSRENYLKKLQGFGLDLELVHILNPALVTIHYLQKNHPDAHVYVIGEDVLKDEFLRSGIQFASSPEETDVVVVSWDRNFHYKHLNFAFRAIKQGAAVIATHPDRTCPMPEGEVPDVAGMIGAIEGTTGITVDIIMGKPSVHTVLAALDILQVQAEDCLMSGDRLETDILMGVNAGMNTALVLTGVTRAEEVQHASVRPDFVMTSVHDIYLQSHQLS
ncbi:HAD-IIA family hydrolase [Paenibacillus lemnae]|uniref:Acid sugar phosphatase n=1 Tax=Paenibacillus lemnae TaxID=1330551 RepID=A0A848M5B0_PAELE|nr:HAD-IIA family hydrolase [Paenibacillus lemnae]NMO95421.1 HAD-IIA family hydrolase [Paenibacillus lemnae]